MTPPRTPGAPPPTPGSTVAPPPTPDGGLTEAEAGRRLQRDGPNELPEPPRPGALRQLMAQLTHLLAVLLWVAAVLAVLAGMPSLAAAIVVIVLLNGVFAFWQEHRADRSTQRLRALLPSGSRVVRDGVPRTVPATELVTGDLVRLEAGDRVGADLAIRTCRELKVDESLVTGESYAVGRGPGEALMAGTFVVQGTGTATVTATGRRTTIAGIAELAGAARRPPSPLTRQLERVVRIVAVIAAGTGLALGGVALGLGLDRTQAFLFGVGVAVALVPEGLLPTVTLSLARGAQVMAEANALVRRLDAVETLGATTFICTDKTGTLTQNRMSVVSVVTGAGQVDLRGEGYAPQAEVTGSDAAREASSRAAEAALACVTGRAVLREGWEADGDPLEAAVHALALRLGAPDHSDRAVRRPFTHERLLSSARVDGQVFVLGAPEAVMQRSSGVPESSAEALASLTREGRRVLGVATRAWAGEASEEMEHDLVFLGLLGLEDPPRPDVGDAIRSCRTAQIRLAMVTGDHPLTAEAIARHVGLLRPGGVVVEGGRLPRDDRELADLLDRPEGAVVARVTPADKLRIAGALRRHGHVVAMTGDGVNDAPALKEADVGVAMGGSGSDVARESADLVLLDDHFATIVKAVELGRATFRNIRRFLTYHLTDNVAELTPFAVWAMTGGQVPLAITVLQVLALDIGTDMLPALALGAEPPRAGLMHGRHRGAVVDRTLLLRSFGVLGATEATFSMAAFVSVLLAGGWTWGAEPSAALMATASGTAFAAIALGQMANAFACRSTTVPVWRLDPRGNPLVVAAVAAEATLLAVFLLLPGLSGLLGGGFPSTLGWAGAATTAAAVVVVDGMAKHLSRRPSRYAYRAPTG
jgi:calcium-translocating P-type ATPase